MIPSKRHSNVPRSIASTGLARAALPLMAVLLAAGCDTPGPGDPAWEGDRVP
jgi:hypothetical protein